MLQCSYNVLSMASSFKRHEQLAPAVQRLASAFLQQHVDPSSYGMITITRVVVTRDLGYATLWVHSVKNRTQLLKYLRPFVLPLERELFQAFAMKRVPRVRFRLDENPEYVERITQLLDRL